MMATIFEPHFSLTILIKKIDLQASNIGSDKSVNDALESYKFLSVMSE